jgi:predicted hotdog family 3-hydroxylacyl-ACP dehydratase
MKQREPVIGDVRRLIPQREPFIMLDRFLGATETEADTALTVCADNLFCTDGVMDEAGVVEHIAQSASAFAGYKALRLDKPTPLGFIGEVRKFRLYCFPRTDDLLTTHLRTISEALGVTLIEAVSRIGEQTVAECQMKIYIKPTE